MEKRIDILDSFRAISILSVILFHFFSRWSPPINLVDVYPYHNQYDYFSQGRLGVQFFFMISGFVIYFTLQKTDNFILFWKKRFIRLFPSILVASIITFFVFVIFDTKYLFPNSHLIKNFIPSITFISPMLFAKFNFSLNYINGSYWSLWPEVQFYVLCSMVYYYNKNKFLFNFVILSLVLIFVNHIFQHILGANKLNLHISWRLEHFYKNWILNCFDIISHLPYFLLGVLFYDIFNKKNYLNITNKKPIVLSIFILGYIIYGNRYSLSFTSIIVIEFVLFYLFLFKPTLLNPIKNKFFSTIGKSSYFLYLIHENIGILIISILGTSLYPNSIILPLILIVLFTVISILYTKYLDSTISNFLKKILITSSKSNQIHQGSN